MIPLLVTTHLRITKKNAVRAFDLQIHFVAKENGLYLGQQSASRRV